MSVVKLNRILRDQTIKVLKALRQKKEVRFHLINQFKCKKLKVGNFLCVQILLIT